MNYFRATTEETSDPQPNEILLQQLKICQKKKKNYTQCVALTPRHIKKLLHRAAGARA